MPNISSASAPPSPKGKRTPETQSSRVEAVVAQLPPIEPRPETWLQKAGVIQMIGLLCAIGVLSLLFLIGWWATLPGPADVQHVLTDITGKALTDLKPDQALDLYTKMRQGHTQQVRDLFQLVVMSAIIPLFTLLAGYVFGKSQAVAGGGGR